MNVIRRAYYDARARGDFVIEGILTYLGIWRSRDIAAAWQRQAELEAMLRESHTELRKAIAVARELQSRLDARSAVVVKSGFGQKGGVS